jgi:hypothetical protein
MSQSDLEVALAEIERVRAAQDDEIRLAFARHADVGATVPLDAEQMRRLSECSEYRSCDSGLRANRIVTAFARC